MRLRRSTVYTLLILGIFGCLLILRDANASPTPSQVRAAVDPAFNVRHVSVALLALAAAADIYTTEQGLHRGCREANPIYGAHPSTASLAATHGALVGLAWYGRTPTWANLTGAALLGVVTVHNSQCKG